MIDYFVYLKYYFKYILKIGFRNKKVKQEYYVKNREHLLEKNKQYYNDNVKIIKTQRTSC